MILSVRAGRHFGLPRLRFHKKSGTQCDGLIEFGELDLGQRVLNRGDQRPHLDQRRNHLFRMRRFVIANRLVENRLDRAAAGQAVPCRVDAVEQILRRGRSAGHRERGAPRAGTPHGAGALAVVHAAAEHREFFIRIAQDGVERAGIDLRTGFRFGHRRNHSGGCGRRAAASASATAGAPPTASPKPPNPAACTSRLACHTCTYFNCSGNILGSAAAVNASLPRMADVWCCPCPSRGVPLKPSRITSGR